jgi:hypothetical protein
MLVTDDFLLYLVHSSIGKFKDRYPDEEPYIKIQCLRTIGRSDKDFNWRETKYTSFRHNKTEIEFDDRKEITTIKEEKKVKMTTTKRVKRRQGESDEVVSRRAIQTSGTTIEDVVETRTKVIEVKHSEDMHVAIEIIDDELDNQIHAIRIDTKYEKIQKDAIMSLEPHQDKVIIYNESKQIVEDENYLMKTLNASLSSERKMSDLSERLTENENKFIEMKNQFENLDILIKENSDLKTELKKYRDLKDLESSVSLIDKINKSFGKNIPVFEIIEKYYELQVKLNKLKKSLEFYIRPLSQRFKDEYYKTVQDNGTLLSALYLIKHYHDICDSDDDMEFEND